MKSTETDTRYVTIVSGLPRSGTSMMMQMLATGGLTPLADNLRRPDEDNPRGYYEFERVKQVATDSSWLEEAERKVVKMVYRLLYDLPADRTYRVVFMTRELDEVVASQEVMLERHGLGANSPDDGLLVEIYRRHLREASDWLHDQPNFSVLFVDYHDVLRDPERVVEALSGFLDGRLDTHAMLQVPDWSLYRQRREAAETAGVSAGT